MLARPLAASAAFYNLADTNGWSLSEGAWQTNVVEVAGGQPSVGSNVLECASNDAWLVSPEIAGATNAVVDFYLRATDSGTATVVVARVSGEITNELGRVAVSSNGWKPFTLFPTNEFMTGTTGRVAFAVAGLTSGAVRLDNVYVGRGLVADANGEIAYRCEAATGIPQMWYPDPANQVAWETLAQTNLGGRTADVFRADMRNQALGLVGTISPYGQLPELPLGNFIAEVEILNQEAAQNDYVQLVGTTNDWASSFDIGDPVARYDVAATNQTWRTNEVRGYRAGLENSRNVRLGFRAVAGGYSGQY
ncbi:MAG: hypothetical protein EOM10_13015, partial [Opitutae bacterium]|nr:hypothetical protein [Opitutae bacterium]